MKTGVKSKALQELSEVASVLTNPAMREWKDSGGKIVGYFCSHVPEEIITAAGMFPVRMRAIGSTGTEVADAFYSNVNCSFPRHCFNMALKGEFDFLDGLIVPNSCDHVRRMYDNWQRQLSTGFVEMFNLPTKTGELQVSRYREEADMMKEKLEKHFGANIDEKRLWDAIELHNDTRSLLRQLYELRKVDHPPITGAQALAVVVASTTMPKRQFNGMLLELLKHIRDTEGSKGYRARLMVVGGILDDPEYLEIIENQGGLVVADSLCFGSRLFWTSIDDKGTKDPLEAIARYHVQQRPSCPRSYGERPRRIKFIKDMVREFKVDGIIGERLRFCDQWAIEHCMNDLDLKEVGIPFMKLDREYALSGKGQLQTRIQAFLEMIGK